MNTETPVETPATYVPTERRPIAARSWTIWQNTALWMANRNFSANSISVAGMIFGILAGIFLALSSFFPLYYRYLFILAAACIQLRLLANLLDGMVAIQSGKASKVGELYNEVPDRISDAGTLIGAGYALGSLPVLGYLATIAAIFTAYIRAMGKAAGAPQDYSGPMAKQQRMATLIGTLIFLAVTPSSWHFTLPQNFTILQTALLIIFAGALLTSFRRLLHISSFLKSHKS